jgi:hypothetical protein
MPGVYTSIACEPERSGVAGRVVNAVTRVLDRGFDTWGR